MRRNLTLEELGDLLERPINAILALHRRDGSILQTPVWHRWDEGRFLLEIPAGDRKIAMLERDPRVSLIVAENEFPYRAIEVHGRAAISSERYRERGRSIVERFVAAHDPERTADAYLSDEPGAIVEIVADAVRAWDYADDAFI